MLLQECVHLNFYDCIYLTLSFFLGHALWHCVKLLFRWIGFIIRYNKNRVDWYIIGKQVLEWLLSSPDGRKPKKEDIYWMICDFQETFKEMFAPSDDEEEIDNLKKLHKAMSNYAEKQKAECRRRKK